MSPNEIKEKLRATIVAFPELDGSGKVLFSPINYIKSTDNKISFSSLITLFCKDDLKGYLCVYLAQCVNEKGKQDENANENVKIMALKLDEFVLSDVVYIQSDVYKKNKTLFSSEGNYHFKNTICSSYKNVATRGHGEYTVVLNYKSNNMEKEYTVATWSFRID